MGLTRSLQVQIYFSQGQTLCECYLLPDKQSAGQTPLYLWVERASALLQLLPGLFSTLIASDLALLVHLSQVLPT